VIAVARAVVADGIAATIRLKVRVAAPRRSPAYRSTSCLPCIAVFQPAQRHRAACPCSAASLPSSARIRQAGPQAQSVRLCPRARGNPSVFACAPNRRCASAPIFTVRSASPRTHVPQHPHRFARCPVAVRACGCRRPASRQVERAARAGLHVADLATYRNDTRLRHRTAGSPGPSG